MLFEIAGFVAGVAGISVAWFLLLRHERDRVFNGLNPQGGQRLPEALRTGRSF